MRSNGVVRNERSDAKTLAQHIHAGLREQFPSGLVEGLMNAGVSGFFVDWSERCRYATAWAETHLAALPDASRREFVELVVADAEGFFPSRTEV